MNARQYNTNVNMSSIYDRPLTSIGYKESMFSSMPSSAPSLKRYTSPGRRPQTTSSNLPSYMTKSVSRGYYMTPNREQRSVMGNTTQLIREPYLNMSMSQQPRAYGASHMNQRSVNDEYNDFGYGFNYERNANLQELKDQILSPGDEENANDLLYARNYERMYGYNSSYRPLTGTVSSSPLYSRQYNITQTNFRNFRREDNSNSEYIQNNREWIRERSKSVERDYRSNYNNSSFDNLSSSFSSDSRNFHTNSYNHLPKYTPSYTRPQTALLPQYHNNLNMQTHSLQTQSILLPPNNTNIKKTLILDLDETLVHSDFRPFYFKPDITLNVRVNHLIEPVYVLKRPYVDEFLRKMSSLYEIVIFTASIPQYANPLLDILDTNKIISYRLFREHCVYNKGLFIKDLNKLGRNLKDVLIVDNNPISYASNKENGIPIPTWHYDKTDTELLKLIPILEHLASVDDVRDVIKRIVHADQVNFYEAKNILNNNNNYMNDIESKVSSSYRSNYQNDIHTPYINIGNFNRNAYMNLNNNIHTMFNSSYKRNNSEMNNIEMQHSAPLIYNNVYPSFVHSEYQSKIRRDMFEKEKERFEREKDFEKEKEIERKRELEREEEFEMENEMERDKEMERMFSNTSSSSFYRRSPSYFGSYNNNSLNNTSTMFSDNYYNRIKNISVSPPSRIQIQDTNISTNNLRPYYYGQINF